MFKKNQSNKFLNYIRFVSLSRQKGKILLTWFTLFVSSVLVLISFIIPSTIKSYENSVLNSNGPFKSNIQYTKNPSNNLIFHFNGAREIGPVAADEWGVFSGNIDASSYNGTFNPDDPSTMPYHMLPINNLTGNIASQVQQFENMMNPISYLGGLLFNSVWLKQLQALNPNLMKLTPVKQIVCPLLGVPKNVWSDDPNSTVTTCINYMLAQTLPIYMKQQIFNGGDVDPSHIYDFTISCGLNAFNAMNEELYTYSDGNIAGSKLNQQVWGLNPNTDYGIENMGGLLNYYNQDPTKTPVFVNATLARTKNYKVNSVFTYQAKIPYVYVKLDSKGFPSSDGTWQKLDPNRQYLHNNSGLALYYCISGIATHNHTTCSDDDNKAEPPMWQTAIRSNTELAGLGLMKLDYETQDVKCIVKGITSDYSAGKILTLRQFVNDWYGYPNFSVDTKVVGGDQYGGFNAKLSKSSIPKDISTFGMTETFNDFTVWGFNGHINDSNDRQYWFNPVFPNGTDQPDQQDFKCTAPGMRDRCIKNLPAEMQFYANSILYGDLEKQSLDKVVAIISTITTLMLIIGITIAFVIILVTTNIIVLDNKRKISNLKTLGYKEKEISKLTISIYWYVVIFAFLCAIPFTIFLTNFALDAISANSSLSLEVDLSWWDLPVAFAIIFISYFISYAINRRAMNKFKAIDILKE